MSYPSFIGEFVAPTEQDDWVNYVRWNERRPVLTRGALNPWETERVRYLWQQEQAAWRKIEPLKAEYAQREKQIRHDVSVFNEHLAELERVTKKKIGMGPIGQYGSMALAVIPGFGWFSAAFSLLNMGFDMLMVNKQKKRINQLMQIMEEARTRIEKNQRRLLAIQEEVRVLMASTERAQQAIAAKREADTVQTRFAQQIYEQARQVQTMKIDLELARIRQANPVRVSYGNEL